MKKILLALSLTGLPIIIVYFLFFYKNSTSLFLDYEKDEAGIKVAYYSLEDPTRNKLGTGNFFEDFIFLVREKINNSLGLNHYYVCFEDKSSLEKDGIPDTKNIKSEVTRIRNEKGEEINFFGDNFCFVMKTDEKITYTPDTRIIMMPYFGSWVTAEVSILPASSAHPYLPDLIVTISLFIVLYVLGVIYKFRLYIFKIFKLKNEGKNVKVKNMKPQELRDKYLNFFKKNGHTIIPSASLIPDNDPTVLFTTAGMHPLVPFLMGEKHPCGKRLVDVQKCIRTGDIDEVGDCTHHTFFEMLGNWSLGDYFKEDAIKFSFEFLTKELKLSLDRLAFSVFKGDDDAPKDEDSAKIWEDLGVSMDRIAYLPKKDNWWGPAGETGPCGPDTEMFYWVDNVNKAPKEFDPNNKGWVEIWNDVFMQYFKDSTGKYLPLKQRNVDTGMGLERTLAALNGLYDNYQTELFLPIIKKIEELSGLEYGSHDGFTRSMRIIADHLRAATFMLGDEKGIVPSNTDQGYILRRLIRRSIVKAKNLDITEKFSAEIAQVVISNYHEAYPELKNNEDKIIEELNKEEDGFDISLKKGGSKAEKVMAEKKLIEIFNKVELFEKNNKQKIVARDFGDYRGLGRDFLNLFTEHGYPLELSLEILNEKKEGLKFPKLTEDEIKAIKEEFNLEFKKHQELSRTASTGKFKGGLADASEETVKGHTATHLLLASLRKVLGDHVFQKGSNITAERLRLDFSHTQKMTKDEIKQVEDMVNEQIQKKIPVTLEEVTLEEAKKQDAMGVFESKYQEQVKVYTIGNFSKEICGGPHVQNTGELGSFKIVQETASSAGIRRIKAVLVK